MKVFRLFDASAGVAPAGALEARLRCGVGAIRKRAWMYGAAAGVAVLVAAVGASGSAAAGGSAVVIARASGAGALIPAAGCRVAGAATEADLVLGRAACLRAEERFTLLFGSPPPAGNVVISDTVSFAAIESYGADWKLVWPSSDRMRAFHGASSDDSAVEEAVELQWTTVLPHELGHVMLISEADVRRPADLPRLRLPDWLHEGTAVWMEPPAYRADGQAILRALRPYVPPLDELLAFVIAPEGPIGAGSTVIRTFFPCASEEACAGRPHWSRIFSVTTRQFPDGTVQVDTTFHATAPPPLSPVGSNFYDYSATLVRFLHDRGGASAMSTLLDRYLRGGEGAAALAGLPGLPRDRRRVEAEWREWFDRWIFAD
jgi:hypothetical protein